MVYVLVENLVWMRQGRGILYLLWGTQCRQYIACKEGTLVTVRRNPWGISLIFHVLPAAGRNHVNSYKDPGRLSKQFGRLLFTSSVHLAIQLRRKMGTATTAHSFGTHKMSKFQLTTATRRFFNRKHCWNVIRSIRPYFQS